MLAVDSELPPAESCVPVEDGIPAALVFAGAELGLVNDRQLVGMQDCGGSVLHWRWTAPPVDVGTVLFAGGLVESDQMKNAQGDRVAKFLRPIASPSVSERRVELSGSCATAAAGSGRHSSAPMSLAGALAVLLLSRRRRAPDRSRHVRN